MKFKDILNTDPVKLENCEDELIHIPGSIQPHGFLLGLKTSDLTIDFCSGNSLELSGLTHEQLLGKPIEIVLGKDQATLLTEYLSSKNSAANAPLPLDFGGRLFSCTVHQTNNIFILELEPRTETTLAISDIYQQTKLVATYMQQATTLKDLCQHVATETKNITGYNRVVIYRFDEQYNGEVYAESKDENLEPWLNLHYPHTDIPAQARALYVKNLIRVIADVNYVPVPVYTIDDVPGKNLDLSLSILRSSSPIHIQYLKNMGVAATLTISLIYENRLWGLIACHHESPKLISNDIRIAAQLQGHFLTSQIGVRELAEEYEVAKKTNKALDHILELVFATKNLSITELIRQPELLALANAAAVIIIIDGETYTHGKVPSVDEIKKLANWLHIYSVSGATNLINLPVVYPDAKKWSELTSGIVFHSLAHDSSNCVIWCRPELIEEIYWAGDPKEAMIKTANLLTPRNSFQSWKETTKYQSAKWLKPELIAATNFASALQKHVHMLFLGREEFKQRMLNEKLTAANTELENLYWIGSHDLNEPLRKIQMFASRIMDKSYEGDINLIYSTVQRMNDSAKRMQLLVSDVLSYSSLNHMEDGLAPVDLNEILHKTIEDLSVEIKEQHATIEYKNLPAVNGAYFLLQQLFINLVRNSLKFSKPGTPPHVVVSYEGKLDQSADTTSNIFYKINVSDNGIGFDNEFKESIFKVFTRLHAQAQYGGTGVGLALCNKIMKNHNGYILADGNPGIGATFSLLFPVE